MGAFGVDKEQDLSLGMFKPYVFAHEGEDARVYGSYRFTKRKLW